MAAVVIPVAEFNLAFNQAWRHIAHQYACLTKHAVIVNFQREFDCKVYTGAWGAVSTVEFPGEQQYLAFLLRWV